MTAVTFYLMPEGSDSDSEMSVASITCDIAAHYFRHKQRVLVYCQSQKDAEEIDELLWQRPVDGFVPHNLTGEGPEAGAPVEITWQPPKMRNRAICINLHKQCPSFTGQFRKLIDFVPAQEDLKKQARERYKQYRAAGHVLTTKPIEPKSAQPKSTEAAPAANLHET